MVSTRTKSQQRGPRILYKVSFTLGWLCGVSAQGQLLESVPADVAAVTIIRSPREFLQKANATAAKLSPDAKAYTWADIESRLGPAAAGFCDIDQPLVIVLTRAEGEGGVLVVGSRVKPPAEGVGRGEIGSPKGGGAASEQDRYFARAREITYVSPRRRALRPFARLRPSTSLAATMDPLEREVARSSDIFVYIRMEAWQDRIRPYVQIASTMAKFSVTAEPSENATEQKMRSEVTSWFIDGAVSVLDQMSSVSLGLALDGETIRLRHHHHFTSGGSVAQYLGKARTSDVPPWACLPDRPFLAAFASNWWSPEQSSLMLGMTRKVFEAVGDGGSVSPGARDKVISASAACYARMRGMNMMMTLDDAETPHMEMFGSYAFDDADEGLRLMRVIQENASEAMSAVTPGGFVGRGVDLTRDGVKYNEVNLEESVMGAEMRAEMERVYGSNARVRQAKVGQKRVLACVNQSTDDFIRLVKAGESEQPLLTNSRIKRLYAGMQPKAQCWMVLDLQRLMTLAGSVVAAEAEAEVSAKTASGKVAVRLKTEKTGDKKAGRATSAPAHEPGPLLGWSALAAGRSFTGEFLIQVDDAAAAVKLTESMLSQFRETVEGE